jgi:two-component system, OmpR family, alkaline phosphatase synthesis response regulator PhoP
LGARILIIDDEAHIRRLISQTLEELEDAGAEISSAEDGAAGLEKAKEVKPNLVFLDVMMPKMNGFEVCDALKHQLGMKETYIILLTAKGQELDRARGQEVGADLYITKPFDPDELLAKAREVLGL